MYIYDELGKNKMFSCMYRKVYLDEEKKSGVIVKITEFILFLSGL